MEIPKNLSGEMLFSTLKLSTVSLAAQLVGVVLDSRYIDKDTFPCRGKIKDISCNWFHNRMEGWIPNYMRKKSKRGRKPKEKTPTTRKRQGDGSSFNSQITFLVEEKMRRKRPLKDDLYSAKAELIPNTDEEYIFKEYKIKVFNTGSMTVPGVLRDDYSDFTFRGGPLDELVDYFRDIYGNDEIYATGFVPNMMNFKSVLIRMPNSTAVPKGLDLYEMCDCFNNTMQGYCKISMKALHSFLAAPTIDGKHFTSWYNVTDGPIDLEAMYRYISDSEQVKDIVVPRTLLNKIIMSSGYKEIYDKMRVLVYAQRRQTSAINPTTYNKIATMLTEPLIDRIHKTIMNENYDRPIYAVYNPQNYCALVVHVGIPTPKDPHLRSTVKIFSSGKINIDACTSVEAAEKVFAYINKVLNDHPELIITGYLNLEHDDEFPDE